MTFYKKIFYFILLFTYHLNYSQNDCTDALVACGNSSYNNLSVSGPGIQEVNGNNSCGSQENNSLWIKINIKTDGTLGFLITPEDTDLEEDFDFFVFGPNATCNNLGSAIRCSTTNPLAAGSTSNITGMNDTEFDEVEGPTENGNNFVYWLDVLQGETYFIVVDRAVGSGNFSLEWTGTATFNEPPIVNQIDTGLLNQELCDADAIIDDSTEFDLDQSGTIAIGTQINLLATYHLTENDAILGDNPITNPGNYSNISNPQTIYIRLENTISSCFSIADFTLNVVQFSPPEPFDLHECDTDNDGFVQFNLNENTTSILSGNPNLVVSYHPSENDLITLPGNYTNQVAYTNETLFVKITNTITGCYAYKPFTVSINSSPVVNSSQLTQCDFGLFPDGLTNFNLTEAINALTNTTAGQIVQFYLNPTDALNNQDELATNYTNTSNPQIISVRVTDSITGCFNFTQLTLNVTSNPTLTVNLNQCDEDGNEDGITTFNLADAGFEIAGTTVNYYLNLDDALLEQNQITTFTFSTQIIYARIENGNDCIGIHIIQLDIIILPAISIESSGTLCLNSTSQPVTLNALIQNPSNYNFLWTPNGETTQSITVFNPGIYTVTANNSLTLCSKTASIEVEVSDISTSFSAEIIDLVNVNSISIVTNGIGDYLYSLDDGPFQQSNFFDDVSIGIHTISITDLNGCGTVIQEVNVLGAPDYFTPNGDGINDTWNIKGVDADFNSKSIVYIFDRFGKLIKQISPIGSGWDGTFNGTQMPSDDYWFTVKFEDGRNAKGNFSLKR